MNRLKAELTPLAEVTLAGKTSSLAGLQTTVAADLPDHAWRFLLISL